METETTVKVPMNPEIKPIWVQALRSDDYKQGKGYLRRLNVDGSEGFCCLGVLCDIYSKSMGIGNWTVNSRFGSSFQMPNGGFSEKVDLPLAVQNWAGLTDNTIRAELALWNDRSDTFSDIADWIEENL